jgi:uncharacterized protein (DUF608 family)
MLVSVILAIIFHGLTEAQPAQSTNASESPPQRLFPTDLQECEWQEFAAAGFSKPVSGVIYRTGKTPCCGVPLGGISTGCLDIEATGVLGFNCLFDAFPRKRQLFKPFLGLAVGNQVWVLTTELIRAGGAFESDHEPRQYATVWRDGTPPGMARVPELQGVHAVKEIHYWGHFPVADLEYEIDAPIGIAIRAWAPFIPGHMKVSNTPAAVFEVHVRNKAPSSQHVTIVFTFPGPTQQEAQVPAKVPHQTMQIGGRSASRPVVPGGIKGRHVRIQTPVNGVSVLTETEVGYCLGVVGNERVRTGGALGSEDWQKVASTLPPETVDHFGASVAVDVELKSSEIKLLRFVLAWYAPEWCGEGEKKYTQMYTSQFTNAVAVAQLVAREHAALLRRILAWQEAIYGSQELPIWLRDTLINVLATIPEDSYWARPIYPVDWAGPAGLFGMNESPRGSPQIECIPCSYCGNIPLVYFFPELARTTLRGYVHYMRHDGAVPFRWGPGSDMSNPTWEWQKSLNGVCFVDMVDRLWLRTADDNVLREFYPAVRKSTHCTMALRPGREGIISLPQYNAGLGWWEAVNWHGDWSGLVTYLGGMRLSSLKITERMAEQMKDTAFAQQCREWYASGSAALERNLWAGDRYLIYRDLETGRQSNEIMANLFDGNWANSFHGLVMVFQPERFAKALSTIQRSCLSQTCGAVGFANADGTPQLRSYGIFVPEIMILGMTYLYAGDRETGLEIIRRLMYNLVCRQRHPFDQPNMLYGDTGERTFGTDYYQNMMLWALPAALAGTDLRGPCAPGGLVARLLAAGEAGNRTPK